MPQQRPVKYSLFKVNLKWPDFGRNEAKVKRLSLPAWGGGGAVTGWRGLACMMPGFGVSSSSSHTACFFFRI